MSDEKQETKKNLFCKTCEALLVKVTTPKDFMYSCESCNSMFNINPYDTLVGDKTLSGQVAEVRVNNIKYDQTVHRIKHMCDCGSDLAIRTIIPDTLNAILVCEKCNKISQKK